MATKTSGKLSAAANRIMERMVEFMVLNWKSDDRRGSQYQQTGFDKTGLTLELGVHDPDSANPRDYYRFTVSLLTPWGKITFAATNDENLQTVYLIERFKQPLGLKLRHDLPSKSGWCYYTITNPEGVYGIPPIKRGAGRS